MRHVRRVLDNMFVVNGKPVEWEVDTIGNVTFYTNEDKYSIPNWKRTQLLELLVVEEKMAEICRRGWDYAVKNHGLH